MFPLQGRPHHTLDICGTVVADIQTRLLHVEHPEAGYDLSL